MSTPNHHPSWASPATWTPQIVYKPLVQKPEAHQLLEESEDTATDSEAHDVSHDNLSDELDSEVEEVPPEAAGPRRVSGRPSIAPSDVSGRRPSTIAGRNSIDPARPRTARRPTQVSVLTPPPPLLLIRAHRGSE